MMNSDELQRAIYDEETNSFVWANNNQMLNWSGYPTGKIDSMEAFYKLNQLLSNIEKLLDREGTAFDITLNTEDSKRVHRQAMAYVHRTSNIKKFKEYAHRVVRCYINWGNAIEG